MNTLKAAPAAGVSFAIPIDTIKSLISELSRWVEPDQVRHVVAESSSDEVWLYLGCWGGGGTH